MRKAFDKKKRFGTLSREGILGCTAGIPAADLGFVPDFPGLSVSDLQGVLK